MEIEHKKAPQQRILHKLVANNLIEMLSASKESKNDDNLKAQSEAKIFFETNFQDIV